ncbi:MAG TPA: bifunctional adenosylcobinamide kinase/adenosylcobinamide-phosphate guanylyltransferase [Candidatus Acidoferrales bacterium]|nr:bifunctional adenosylcobinamide kinase/adenosylcobinamide-phosphate guanylyltransferase [Candidatus Acidoferrales bacterium]
MIYFITGGERSGKSNYAQRLGLQLSKRPVYVATSRIWDEDFKKRVARHRKDRGASWEVIEEEKKLGTLDLTNKVAVIDCVTLWITNFWVDTNYDLERSLKEIKREFDLLRKIHCTLIIISNEIGMGIHADTEKGRKFVELQGWVNQYIAENADRAIFIVSGIPVQIKNE